MDTRKEFILNMRAKRMNYADIGKLLGISRQRVHQICTGYASPSMLYVKPAIDHKVLTAKKIKALGLNLLAQPIGIKVFPYGGGRDVIRERVRIRDNHTCQICLKVWTPGQRRFDVHHTDESLEGRSAERGICKSDRENTDKMITLCHKCHLNLDSVRRKMGATRRAA